MSKQKINYLPSVLITGCSSETGNATALRFAKAGYPTCCLTSSQLYCINTRKSKNLLGTNIKNLLISKKVYKVMYKPNSISKISL
jgi:hypothetical protein